MGIRFEIRALNCRRRFIDFTSSNEIKSKSINKSLIEFWAGMDDEFSALKIIVSRILLTFPAFYFCENRFSAMTALKTKYRP